MNGYQPAHGETVGGFVGAGNLRNILAALRAAGFKVEDPQEQTGVEILMFLDATAPVAAELSAGDAQELRATRGIAVRFRRLSPARHAELHAAGVCRGCTFDVTDEDRPVAPLAHGVFQYEHLSENVYAGPYGRRGVPLAPVRLEALPPELRAAAERARFDDLVFADTGQLQPAAHLPSSSWDGAWLDPATRELRPCPGQERDFAKAYGPGAPGRADLAALGVTPVDPPSRPSLWRRLFGRR